MKRFCLFIALFGAFLCFLGAQNLSADQSEEAVRRKHHGKETVSSYADETNDQKGVSKKPNIYLRKESNAFDRFMNRYVNSFLIIGLLFGLLGILVVFLFGLDQVWKKMALVYLNIYVFFLLNFVIWFLTKSTLAGIISMSLTSGLVVVVFLLHVLDQKREKQYVKVDRTKQWICISCNSTNRHSLKCWNCGSEKS